MKLMQKYFYGLSGKTIKRRRSVRLSRKPPITPEKKAEIDSRRKVIFVSNKVGGGIFEFELLSFLLSRNGFQGVILQNYEAIF